MSVTINNCTRLFTAATIGILHLPAGAESLRCSGGIVTEGESKISVVFKCGQPLFKDSFCAPVYYNPTLQSFPGHAATVVVPCQKTDEWLYDRGSGSLLATVRFHAGSVLSITYGPARR